MKVDMSPEAVTGRMQMLDQLWELTVALKSSKIVGNCKSNLDEKKENRESEKENPGFGKNEHI